MSSPDSTQGGLATLVKFVGETRYERSRHFTLIRGTGDPPTMTLKHELRCVRVSRVQCTHSTLYFGQTDVVGRVSTPMGAPSLSGSTARDSCTEVVTKNCPGHASVSLRGVPIGTGLGFLDISVMEWTVSLKFNVYLIQTSNRLEFDSSSSPTRSSRVTLVSPGL